MHSHEFKAEVLKLAEKVGVAAAADSSLCLKLRSRVGVSHSMKVESIQ